ncbi:protease HtpX-like protein [Legionella nautarum]|uniref:Protease HtpX-like protein n=1 Tax=Legionella nautarum TaxID=45070 RepID=A0A0W0WLN6_9GAMM|nr:M48 family metallopeptidase [Legionella nautarum]KTD33244.1 protease HtpX-like protein [Legionella nautarum]
MENFKKGIFIIYIVVLVSLIPSIGILVGSVVSNGYEKQYEEAMIRIFKEKQGVDLKQNQQVLEQIKLKVICSKNNLDPAFSAVCSEFDQINNLTYFSSITIIFTILVFVFIFSLGLLSRQNRNFLFYFFKPGLFISQISAAILVAANAGILVFSIYFTESFYWGKVHIGLIVGLGIGAGIMAIRVFIQSVLPIKDVETRVVGKILSKDAYPTIWNFVESLAKMIGTEPPDTIIAGMEPTFFVTEANVLCLDGKIHGRSLFVSLPFCRSLSKQEFSAIIGHEMGHFIGQDTKWSKKFYPIYRGATDTVLSLDGSNKDGIAQLAFFPSLVFMNIFISAFMTSEKAISRQRELNADSVGMKITSKEEMGGALVKAHLYQHVWDYTQQKMKENLANGKQIINLSAFFSSICEALPQDFMKDEVGKTHTPHPTDSHPPLSVRLNSMSIKIDEVYGRGIINTNDERAITLIDEVETLEKELSDIEYYKLIQLDPNNPGLEKQ